MDIVEAELFLALLNRSEEKPKEWINVLLLGDQHSGKSSFLNSIGRAFLNWNTEQVPVGRTYLAGTTLLMAYEFSSLKLRFIDTMGKRFSTPLSELDLLYAQKLLKGLPPVTDLFTNDWANVREDPNYRIHHVILVVAADRMKESVTTTTGRWFWKTETVSDQFTLSRYSFIPQLYGFFEAQLKLPPIVIVTKMDLLSETLQRAIKKRVSDIGHENCVVFMTTWNQRERELNNVSKENIDLVIKMLYDNAKQKNLFVRKF